MSTVIQVKHHDNHYTHFMPGFVCSNMNFLQCSQANTDRNNSNSGNNRQLSEQKQNDEEEEVREVKQKKNLTKRKSQQKTAIKKYQMK